MYVRACADDGCASVGIEIHSFLVARVITITGPDLGGGGGNRGGCPGPTAFEGAPMVLIIMIFMFLGVIVTRSKLLICVN